MSYLIMEVKSVIHQADPQTKNATHCWVQTAFLSAKSRLNEMFETYSAKKETFQSK